MPLVTCHVSLVACQLDCMHGRYTATLYDAGLPVLKSGVDSLHSMGVTAIRLGGSFTDADFYFWKRWIGNPWERLVLHTGPTFYGAQAHAFSSSCFFIYIFLLTCAKLIDIVTFSCKAIARSKVGGRVDFGLGAGVNPHSNQLDTPSIATTSGVNPIATSWMPSP